MVWIEGGAMMEDETYPKVISFVLRFVQDSTEAEARKNYRGVIRHVQSNQEVIFSRWSEVETYIAHFIDLDER
jgi:hypothetical protein